MDTSSIDYSQIIIDTINELFSSLFSSIDNSIYSLLDKITFIDESILSDNLFDKALNSVYGLTSIANALLIGFVIYYCSRLMLSHFIGIHIEKPYQFLTKVLLCCICINSSMFFCEEILKINSLVSDCICEIGNNICSKDISFNTLIEETNIFLNSNTEFNIFSFNGIIKSVITSGLISLLFSYSIRFILVKIFILLSPFAILSLVMQSTSWLFKIWLRTICSLLLLQSFVSLILLIILTINLSSLDVLSQISYISAIYILSKANSYIKELLGGISTDFNYNIASLKTLFR